MKPHSTFNIEWSANYWHLIGLPKEKIMVGIPTYGKRFTLYSKYLNYPGSLAVSSNGDSTYSEVCDFLNLNNTVKVRSCLLAGWLDRRAKCPFSLTPIYLSLRRWIIMQRWPTPSMATTGSATRTRAAPEPRHTGFGRIISEEQCSSASTQTTFAFAAATLHFHCTKQCEMCFWAVEGTLGNHLLFGGHYSSAHFCYLPILATVCSFQQLNPSSQLTAHSTAL